MHCPNGTVFILKKDVGVCKWFPYLDITKLQEHTKDSKNTQEAVSASHVALMQTVRGDYEGFTDRDIKAAILARETQAMMGYPYEKSLVQWWATKP